MVHSWFMLYYHENNGIIRSSLRVRTASSYHWLRINLGSLTSNILEYPDISSTLSRCVCRGGKRSSHRKATKHLTTPLKSQELYNQINFIINSFIPIAYAHISINKTLFIALVILINFNRFTFNMTTFYLIYVHTCGNKGNNIRMTFVDVKSISKVRFILRLIYIFILVCRYILRRYNKIPYDL